MKIKEVPIVNVSTISSDSVKAFEGIRYYLSTGNLEKDSISNLEIVDYNTKPSRANLNVKDNDVILARMKETNKVFCIDKNNENLIVSTGFIVLRPNLDKLNPKFLFFYLRSDSFQKAKDLLCSGATQKAINNESFKTLTIPLPPLEEQIKIASILERADKLRQKRKETNKLFDKILQSVFLDMFGDLEKNEKNWDYKEVREFVEKFETGKSIQSLDSEMHFSKNRILKISAVTYGLFKPDESKPIDNSYSPLEKHFVRKGDLLFSRANTSELIGATAYVFENYDNLILPDKLWRFVWNKDVKVEPLFIWHLFQQKFFRREISSRATGTSGSMKNISQENVLSIKVPFPDYSLQKEFARIVQKIESLKEKAKKQEQDLEIFFNSLMQYAFNGRLDLSGVNSTPSPFSSFREGEKEMVLG
ncbi:MAG: restriction endonuclease subunit S [Candidatus Sericytochromatia bacterium]